MWNNQTVFVLFLLKGHNKVLCCQIKRKVVLLKLCFFNLFLFKAANDEKEECKSVQILPAATYHIRLTTAAGNSLKSNVCEKQLVFTFLFSTAASCFFFLSRKLWEKSFSLFVDLNDIFPLIQPSSLRTSAALHCIAFKLFEFSFVLCYSPEMSGAVTSSTATLGMMMRRLRPDEAPLWGLKTRWHLTNEASVCLVCLECLVFVGRLLVWFVHWGWQSIYHH